MSLAPSPFEVAADLLWPHANQYLEDPAGWAKDRLDEFWWSGQREMAEMVVRNRYSAIKASHDVSKSHTMSHLACWWIDVHPPGEAFVVTTAPTTAQVEAICHARLSTERLAIPAGSARLAARRVHRVGLEDVGERPVDALYVVPTLWVPRALGMSSRAEVIRWYST
jgi:hypothetical protein